MLSTRMTRKGQVTIPAEIRDALGLQQGDVLIVEQTEDGIVMKNQRRLAESTRGILSEYANNAPPLPEGRDWFEEAVAAEAIESMSDSEE